MKTLVCKLATSFIEPCCAQPCNIDDKHFLFSSDVWAVFALLRKNGIPVDYVELEPSHKESDFELLEDYSHVVFFAPLPRSLEKLYELRDLTERMKRGIRNTVVVARTMGFSKALTAEGYVSGDVIVTADDTLAAMTILIDDGFFKGNQNLEQRFLGKEEVRPMDCIHERASFLDVLDEVERYDYRTLPGMEKQRSLSAGIGCVHGCTYCAKQRSPWRAVEPKQLAREVAYWDSLPLMLFHNELFHKRPWLERFIDAMAKYPANRRMLSLGRIDTMYHCRDLFPALSAIGLKSFSIGLESVNQRILSSMHKDQNEFWKLDVLFEEADKVGIELNCNILLGMPEEGHDSLREVYDFVKNYHKTINISLLMPLPNTPVYAELVELGFLTPSETMAHDFVSTFEKVTSSVGHVRTKHLTLEELEEWHKRFMNLRNSYLPFGVKGAAAKSSLSRS